MGRDLRDVIRNTGTDVSECQGRTERACSTSRCGQYSADDLLDFGVECSDLLVTIRLAKLS